MIFTGPEARTPLEVLDADVRVHISASGSFLDAEPGCDQ